MFNITTAGSLQTVRIQTIVWITALTVLMTLSGCKPGPIDRFDQRDLGFMVEGQTSRQEVIAKLGQPTTSSISHTRRHQLSWTYDKATADGNTYLPFTGALMGKGPAPTKVISAVFDQHGILMNYALTETLAQPIVQQSSP